jgi:hypothetical protein
MTRIFMIVHPLKCVLAYVKRLKQTPYDLIFNLITTYFNQELDRENLFLKIWNSCSYNVISVDSIILSIDNITYFHLRKDVGLIYYSYTHVLYPFDMNYDLDHSDIDTFIKQMLYKHYSISGLEPMAL